MSVKHYPKGGPVYIHLFHGRKDPKEQLDDWGLDGPTFGPYDSIQVTYESHIKMHGSHDCFHELHWVDGLVYYDGVFYGDITIHSIDTDDKAELWRAEKASPANMDDAFPMKVVCTDARYTNLLTVRNVYIATGIGGESGEYFELEADDEGHPGGFLRDRFEVLERVSDAGKAINDD